MTGDRPKGRFGLSRLTDIGPQVSYHNNKPSDCSKQLCYNGHTKREVFVSIRDAYAQYKDRIIATLEDNGVPVEELVISGSVVTGDFGCRDKKKIVEEIEELYHDVWGMSAEFPDEVADSIYRIVQNEDKPLVMWRKANKEVEQLKSENDYDRMQGERVDDMLDDLLVSICSDIDFFVVFPDSTKSQARRRWNSREVQMALDPVLEEMINSIKGRMTPIFSESNETMQENMDAPTISSVDDFDRVIDKYY